MRRLPAGVISTASTSRPEGAQGVDELRLDAVPGGVLPGTAHGWATSLCCCRVHDSGCPARRSDRAIGSPPCPALPPRARVVRRSRRRRWPPSRRPGRLPLGTGRRRRDRSRPAHRAGTGRRRHRAWPPPPWPPPTPGRGPGRPGRGPAPRTGRPAGRRHADAPGARRPARRGARRPTEAAAAAGRPAAAAAALRAGADRRSSGSQETLADGRRRAAERRLRPGCWPRMSAGVAQQRTRLGAIDAGATP